MTRIPAATSTFARSPRRLRLTLAVTGLSVLALGACGTEGTAKPTVGAEQTKRAEAVGGQAGPSLTQIRDRFEQSCPPSAPPEGPPTGPAEELPPGAEVPSDAIEPIAPAAGPEVELNARDWCASNLHEERIAQALWNLVDPSPTKVRTILNDLGYADERIHDLKQSGASTRFFLDLREKGGRLCLEGSAAGERTVIDKCVAPATGPFTPGVRKQ
ncbi:hypothetical protein [Streptomyces sp. NBC_00887]|uniref:hypothetical protein n=1 Tax=Streptomyces sp. NBC_00887 TaxID=2975859 RepID=UPI0038649941|nr:hypothetical protein OG844_01905 [Streptomyces sp. NBC_00887]WSY36893.1 hypothetical protein OG844_43695 [Streptomyces sp. NBC_00887]